MTRLYRHPHQTNLIASNGDSSFLLVMAFIFFGLMMFGGQ